MKFRVHSRHHLLLVGIWLLALPMLMAVAADEKSEKKSPVDSSKASSKESAAPHDADVDRKADEEYFELYKSLADTIDQVERNYVKPIDRRELMEAAINGILTKLDPYSSYIDSTKIGSFRTDVEHEFGGIGIQVTLDENGQLKVSSPLVGSPAYKAGVLAGDKIVKIEGESTSGISLEQAVKRLKGEAGTSVSFTVEHPLSGKTETFSIQREMVHVDSVMGDARKPDDSWEFMLDPKQRIGYIRISMFSRDTAADLKQALEKLQKEKMRGLILDLRFNPGGLLTTAIDVCKMFIDEGRIVSIQGRNTPQQVWDATEKGEFDNFPIAILVNRYSASASEIVSACLQDHHRAVIIGERTFGKGSVQNLIELEDGKSALKLTTATYTRPNGHNIHRFPDAKDTDEWGVKPDEGKEVKLDEVETSMLMADRRRHEVVLGKSNDKQSDQTLADANAANSTQSAANSGAAAEQKPAVNSDHAAAASGKAAAADSAAKQKPSTANRGSNFVDRQLQKAIDYLTTELGHAS